MKELDFRNWVLSGADSHIREILESCNSGDYYTSSDCDAEWVSDEFEEALVERFQTDFIVSNGVEKIVVSQPEWEHVYKFQVNTVGCDYGDFTEICQWAENAGLGDMFLKEEELCWLGTVLVTTQSQLRGGEYKDYWDASNRAKQLSRETRDTIQNSENETLSLWTYTLYGAERLSQLLNFLEENGIFDIHSGNFIVENGEIKIYDASLRN